MVNLHVKKAGGETPEEVPPIRDAPAGVLEDGSLDPVYEAKAKVLNKAIQDIGMGRYQWQVDNPRVLHHTDTPDDTRSSLSSLASAGRWITYGLLLPA